MSPNGGGHHAAEAHCELPDAVVGVGGTGCEAVCEFFRQDWVLAEELEPREGDRMPSTQGFVVDTATEGRTDERVARVNERIRVTAEETFGRKPGEYATELHTVNPVADVPPRYTSADGLTDDALVTDIADHDGLNAWWLARNGHLLNEREHYDSGVNLRRALGKALYHASNAGGDPLSRLVRPAAFDSVTMVVGLGGGTGSGIMTDLARRLDEAGIGVDLVGVLPAADEEEGYKANAHAALSELEYLSVEENATNPFRSMTLVPFGPAYEDPDDIQSFREQLAYVVVAQRNLPGVPHAPNAAGPWPLLAENLPSYAPFTVVAPQTLRFDAGERHRARGELRDWLAERRETLAVETDLYDALESYVETHFAGEPPERALSEAADGAGPADHAAFGLHTAAAKQLRHRLDGLRSLLAEDMAALLDGDPAAWADELAAREADALDALGDDADETERDQTVVFALTAAGFQDLPPEEDDSPLAAYVRRELRALNRRATLFAVAATIEDETLREGVRWALNGETGYHLRSLQHGLVDRRDAVDALERNVEVLDTLLGESRAIESDDVLPECVEAAKDAWSEAAFPAVERIVVIDRYREEIRRLVEDLDAAIHGAIEEIQRWHAPDEAREDPLEFDSFARLNARLEAVGVTPVPESEIRGAVHEAAVARRHQLEDAARGPLGRIADVFGGDEHEAAYDAARANLPGWLSLPPFDAVFATECTTDWLRDRIDEVTALRDEAVEDTVAAFEYDARAELDDRPVDGALRAAWTGEEPRFFTAPPEEFETDRLRMALERDFGDLDPEGAIDALVSDEPSAESDVENAVHEILARALLEPVREERARVESALADRRDEAERYDALLDRVRNSDWGRVGGEAFCPDIDPLPDPSDDRPYIEAAVADGAAQAAENAAEAGLLTEREPTVEAALGRFVHAATEPPLLPLNERRIASPRSRYLGHRVSTAFMNPALRSGDEDGMDLFDDLERRYRDAVPVPTGEQGYRAVCLGAGGDWDVSTVTFVSGVFLDNLRPVTGREQSYDDAYRAHREELDGAVRARHAHGLDGTDENVAPNAGEGGYVSRTDFFDLADPEDEARFADGDEASLAEAVRDRIDAATFASTVDIERDARR